MLAEKKDVNNSYKLKNKISKYFIFSNKIAKKLQQFNQVIKVMKDNRLVIITEPETFHFD